MAKKKTTKSRGKKKKHIVFYKDPRVIKIFGASIIAFSLMLMCSLVSYLLTWRDDQDMVLQFSWEIFLQKDLSMSNLFGRFGAFTSCMICYWGFGLASFLGLMMIARLGLKLIRMEPWHIFLKTARRLSFAMFLFALIFATVTPNSEFAYGGVIGQGMYIWLSNFLGHVGLIFLLLFITAAIYLWVINPDLRNIALFKYQLKPVGDTLGSLKPRFNFRSNKAESAEPIASPFKAQERPAQEKPHQAEIILKEDEAEAAAQDSGQQLEIKLDDERKVNPMPPAKKAKAEKSSAPNLQINNNPQHDPTLDLFKENEGPVAKNAQKELPKEAFDPKAELSKYKIPEMDLLFDYEDQKVEIDKTELRAQCQQIVDTLATYKIEITNITATIGPTVTLFEVVPAPGVRINKIKNLEDDIALSLSALGIRIIAPIPGKGTVGIEVPNKKRQIVSSKEVFKSSKFTDTKMTLPIALGKTISNEVFVTDLAKMPHLLVAGATGQGKSVGINQMLISLLYKMHPAELKFVMIDPKMVELSLYSRLDKHFLAILPDQEEAIITDTTKVIHTLNSLCIEMDQRYELLKTARVRSIKEYNAKFTQRQLNPMNGHKFLPFLVLVIDEFADLIMTAGKEIELPIARLAQKARAVGIHLIIATQRPSVNIITGMIKANFPARLAFKVQQKVDSRTILDAGGAEQLTGMGDMLFGTGGKMIRLQCAFVDTPEVEKVIEYIGQQRGYHEPYMLPEFTGEEGGNNGEMSKADLDTRFMEAARMVVTSQSGSTSMLQRKLQLGYNRAGRIMDQMEALGIVSASKGSKPREVLVYSEMELEQIMDSI